MLFFNRANYIAIAKQQVDALYEHVERKTKGESGQLTEGTHCLLRNLSKINTVLTHIAALQADDGVSTGNSFRTPSP